LKFSRVVTPLVIGLTTALALTGFTELSGLTGRPVQSALATAARPDSGQWTTLRQQLEPLVADAARQHVTIGITARNLAAPHEKQNLDIGSMGPFKAASTIKLGLASMIMKGIDEGKWTLDNKVTVTPDDIVGGTGTLQKEGKGAFPQAITLGRLMRLMITVSDNTATNVLIDFVGGFDSINHFTQNLGLADAGFHFGRKMILPHPPEQENWISPTEDAELLAMIYNSTFLSKASSSQIISWMRQQQVNTKFGAVIPRDDLANKTGENTDVSHDTGYLLVPGKETVLSVMTSFNPADFSGANTGFDTASIEVQKVAKAVYDYLQRQTPSK
jgi:beta-lactamase class A